VLVEAPAGTRRPFGDPRSHRLTPDDTHLLSDLHEHTLDARSSIPFGYRARVQAESFDAIAEARRQWVQHEIPEPLPMAAATSIIRANQLVTTRVDRALRPLGLTFARYELLMLLSFSRNGALPITTMGPRLMVHPTGVSKLVDKLEQQDLVRREPNPRDRRSTLARITPTGRRVAKKASGAVAGIRFGTDLSDRDLERLTALLTSLRRRAGDLGGGVKDQPE